VGSIRSKVVEIKELVAEIERQLDILEKSQKLEGVSSASPRKPPEEIPAPEALRAEFDQLYLRVNEGDASAITTFVAQKSSKYLDAFCRANSLSADAKKIGKAKVSEEIGRTIAQRRAISKTTLS